MSGDRFGIEPDAVASGGGSPTGAAGGNLSGTYPNPDVVKVQGIPVDITGITAGAVASYDGTKIVFSQVPMPVETGLTYSTAPTLDGQLYSYISNNTVDLSISDTIARAKAFAGVWSASRNGLQTIRGYPISVRFRPGLTLSGGTVFCMVEDAVAMGLATNVLPSTVGHYIKILGSIIDASIYNPADPTGSLALCLLDPQPPIQVI